MMRVSNCRLGVTHIDPDHRSTDLEIISQSLSLLSSVGQVSHTWAQEFIWLAVVSWLALENKVYSWNMSLNVLIIRLSRNALSPT